MTFSFQSITRPSFRLHPVGGDPVAGGIKVQADTHRAALLAEAAQVLDHLPAPGESFHALMTGRYDLMHLLLVILDNRPEPVSEMRIATLSYNAKNLHEILRLLDSGKVKRLGFLCSKFFKENTKDVYETTLRELRARGQRLAAPRSHAKVVTMEFAAGDKLVLEGSANLRTNSNQEQFALFNHAALHDWHAGWIDRMIAEHEIDQSGSAKTG